MPFVSEPGLGALCATASALAWTLTGLLVRALSPTFNSVTVNAIRSTLAGGLVLAWVLSTGGVRELTTMSASAVALLSISVFVAVGIGDTVFFESTRELGLARAMTISMTYPLVSALLAAAFLGEALDVRVAVGSLVTLAGVALTVRAGRHDAPQRPRFLPGVGAATLASLAWAVSVVLLKPTLGEVDAIRAQAVRLPVAAGVLWVTPWAWSPTSPLRRHRAPVLWQLLALGGLTAVGSILFVAGVRHAGVAVATVLSSTAPVFAIPLGLVFLGERVAPAAIVGTILTVVGIGVLEL
jgi:drug/metabolite transporter (DMT)-like permease